MSATPQLCKGVDDKGARDGADRGLTLPVPPSPTRTNLKVGIS